MNISKKLLALVIVLISSIGCYAQNVTIYEEEDGSLQSVASYPGGAGALMNFLDKNTVYPEQAQKNGIQGRVIVSFVVNEDGSLSDFKVTRSIDTILDAEAINVAKKMPKWVPAVANGQKVKMRKTIPVSFKLQ